MKKKYIKTFYDGWELDFFDDSKNFRSYQYKLIKNFLKGHIAEIGPGNGANLNYYLKHSKRIDLYEPEKKLFLNLRKKYKRKSVSIFNRKFKTQKNKYDTILYLDVLEHIKEDKKEIHKAFKSLKKNGYLIINVPAYSHLYSKFDKEIGHYKRYNKDDFKIIFKNLNYSSLDLKYYDLIGYIFALMSKIFVTNYKNNFEQKIKIWNSLIPLSKLLDFLMRNLAGKSLLVIAKK